jgi:hypothetical protein
MMPLADLLTTLARRGVRLRADCDTLYVEAPRGTLTPEIVAALTEHRPTLRATFGLPASTEPAGADETPSCAGAAVVSAQGGCVGAPLDDYSAAEREAIEWVERLDDGQADKVLATAGAEWQSLVAADLAQAIDDAGERREPLDDGLFEIDLGRGPELWVEREEIEGERRYRTCTRLGRERDDDELVVEPPDNPCPDCGGLRCWWTLASTTRCQDCDPPTLAIEWAERADALRRRYGIGLQQR